jgi:carboxyl-terminal processing protease
MNDRQPAEHCDPQIGPPFAGCAAVAVVVPTDFAALSAAGQDALRSMPQVLADSRAGLERELGAPITIVSDDPGAGPRWLIGPAGCNPSLASLRPPAADPELFLDRGAQLLITDAPTPDGVWETFSWLRSLVRFPGGTLVVSDCASTAAAVERIYAEVGDSYPAFGLRGLDWTALAAIHRERVAGSADPILAMQEWLAELQDTHTWVRPARPPGQLPYRLRLSEEQAEFVSVPAGSAAWEVGVRPGFQLAEVDCASWWRRTAATPHARPLVAGLRCLSGEVGAWRELAARAPNGDELRWRERIPDEPWERLVEWAGLPDRIGYLRINSWRRAAELEASVDAALADFTGYGRLIVDLRGNGGGSLALAQRFRDRFLREPTVVGAIRHSAGHGVLTPAEPLLAEPADAARRWPGRVRFLTDQLTYSASEDAILGLQGLSHVEVLGSPSGGGSGRSRALRLLPGWNLTISTALTYDRQGRCIEGSGIPLDRRIDPGTAGSFDVVLEVARRGW